MPSSEVIENSIKENNKSAYENNTKFFQHWAILSGATLTLIVPFLADVKSENISILQKSNIKWILAFLVISLILSSFEILLSSWRYKRTAILKYDLTKECKRKQTKIMNVLIYTKFIFEVVAIFSYIIAIIMLANFLITYLVS